MNTNDENRFADSVNKEINLRYLVFFVLKKWRHILRWVLIIVAAALLVSAALLALDQSNEEHMAASRYHFDNELSTYTNQVEALRSEIALISGNLAKQKAYYDNSLLMKIDPYHNTVSSSVYYVDTGYQIIPENTYQDIDYSSRLLRMYMAWLNGGEAYARLMESMEGITDDQYVREVFGASADNSTSTITVTAVSGDAQTGQEMLTIIRAGMNEVHDKAAETIVAHRLTEINTNVYSFVDLSLADKQKQNFEQILTYSTQLKEKDAALQALKNGEDEPVWEYSPLRVALRFIKIAVIAAVLGLIAAAVWAAVYYLVSDKVLDADKLTALNAVNLLGAIPGGTKKRAGALDRLAARICGVKLTGNGRDGALALTAQSIHSTALASGMKEGKIAIAGSVGAETLEELAGVFNKAVPDVKLRFEAAGDPMRDVFSAQSIGAAGVTVLVARQESSLCSDVVKENARILAWGKPVLGAVLLDADIR